MKIAITSQNKREITGHAGKCRKFWIYEINEGKISNKELLEFLEVMRGPRTAEQLDLFDK